MMPELCRVLSEGYAMSDTRELHPNEIVRWKDAPKYFGLRGSQLYEKIKAGEIEPPIALSASGRAKGFLGQQIIEHQQRQRELSKRKGT